jgi:hypothetical protein
LQLQPSVLAAKLRGDFIIPPEFTLQKDFFLLLAKSPFFLGNLHFFFRKEKGRGGKLRGDFVLFETFFDEVSILFTVRLCF